MNDEQAIRDLVDSWMASTRAGDVASVLKLMADDAIFMVPGREPFGKKEFEAQSEQLKNVQIDGGAKIQEIRVFGDWAYLRSYLTVVMTPADGRAPVRRAGYTLSILRKRLDGQWAIVRDANLLAEDETSEQPGFLGPA